MALNPELDSVICNYSEPNVPLLSPTKLNGHVSTFTFQEKWGLPVEDVYKLAIRFYREKDGKAPLHISYGDKLRLVAYTKQIAHGPFLPSLVPEVGFLDVIGSDRRRAWSILGEMSKEDAMLRFVDLLDLLCPLFKPYIEAHKRDREDQEKKRLGNGTDDNRHDETHLSRSTENGGNLSEITDVAPQYELAPEHEQQIRDALNAQTLQQFKAFCEQQLPGKVDEQKTLIAKLQEEHFRQYVRHWMEYQANNPDVIPNGDIHQSNDDQNTKQEDHGSDEENEEVMTSQAPNIGGAIQTASVWTRKDLKEFKDSVKKEGGEGILKIGQGETVTIRVPTHPEGNYLFWEFATDHYDLGFGLFFEWSNNTNDNRVTIHVSETDEDDEDLDGEGPPPGPNDPEKGGPNGGQSGPPVDEILPVYRRDCHEEVIAGSHLYPARQGVYLLKFDNSFSLWRSKTLYYRVYYTR